MKKKLMILLLIITSIFFVLFGFVSSSYSSFYLTNQLTDNSLIDNKQGNLDGQGSCSVPQTLAPGESYTCSFPAILSGNDGDVVTNLAEAFGVDDDGQPLYASDVADVNILGVPPAATLGGRSRLYKRSLNTSTPLAPGPPRNLCGEMNTASSEASPSYWPAGGFMSISTYGALAA